VGEELNGEARTASNKRKRAHRDPYIDDELMGTLKRWLAVRRTVGPSSADPLFVGTAEGWGERLDPQAVRHVVERYAREAGGGTVRVAVPPRTSRPTTSGTSSRRISGTGRAIAASSSTLRGDVADDVIDTYTHNWGDQVRETYEANVYQLLR